MHKVEILFVFLFLHFLILSAQDTQKKIEYTSEFKFKDGIYLNFEQVKNNSPILKSRLLTTLDDNDREFFTQLTKDKTISYYDDFGVKKEVPVKNLWGYSDHGVLYIYLNQEFNRITVVGSICHFVANLTTYNYYYDPYSYNSYYRATSPYNTPSQQTELRQYIMSFENGKVYDYDVSSLELLLMKDEELYDDYMGLRNKKKKQLKFLYIRKFNEKNPLYIPVH